MSRPSHEEHEKCRFAIKFAVKTSERVQTLRLGRLLAAKQHRDTTTRSNTRSTMVWSCGACTFENTSDNAATCEICTTVRPGMEQSITAASHGVESFTAKRNNDGRKMKQRNLFGGIIKSPETTGSSKSRKRKDLPDTRPSAFVEAACAAAVLPGARKSAFVEAARAAAAPAAVEISINNSRRAGIKQPRSELEVKPKANTPRPAIHPQSGIFVQQKVMWNTAFPSLWEKAMKNMKSIFRIDALRNLQPVAVESSLKRQSQIIVMATGGGKSLCYQLPATVLGGVTLVISPLIALMVDQVQALNDKGVSAALVSSASGARNNNEVMERLLGRPLKAQKKKSKNLPDLKPITVLYGTPELCQTERFRKILVELNEQNRLAMFAIDEAHCLSTWGHDFRPAYRKLQWLRSSFPHIPCTVCTATATGKVIEDIRSVLLLKPGEVPCHMGSFNRPNISYEVRFKQSLDAMSVNGAMGDLVDLVQQQYTAAAAESRPCSGIIYVHKRQDCDTLAKELTKKAGIRAAAYHGGLKDSQRSEVQRQWTCGAIQVAVATIAFGMGIDLAHVRFVIHWSLAKSVEGFYQESGRAGRDGLAAISVLYFSKDEASKFSYLIQKQNSSSKDPQGSNKSMERSLDALQLMVNYCVTPCCRRQYLLEHFGEKVDPKLVCKETCDYCRNPKQIEQRIEGSQVVQDVVNIRNGFTRRGQQPSSPAKWDGQWSKPHGDDGGEGEWDDVWTEGDLGITSSGGEYGMFEEASSAAASLQRENASMKTSSILDKYEVRMVSAYLLCFEWINKLILR